MSGNINFLIQIFCLIQSFTFLIINHNKQQNKIVGEFHQQNLNLPAALKYSDIGIVNENKDYE